MSFHAPSRTTKSECHEAGLAQVRIRDPALTPIRVARHSALQFTSALAIIVLRHTDYISYAAYRVLSVLTTPPHNTRSDCTTMATLSPPSLHKQGSFTRTRQRTPSTSLRLTTELSPISSRERDNTYSHALGGGGGSSSALDYGGDGQGTTSSSSGSSMSGDASAGKRGRSSSILSMHEIKENYDDDLDQHALTNLNADWVNYKGRWDGHVRTV